MKRKFKLNYRSLKRRNRENSERKEKRLNNKKS